MCRRLFIALGMLLAVSVWAVELDLPDQGAMPDLPEQSVEANAISSNPHTAVAEALLDAHGAETEEEIVIDLPSQLEIVPKDIPDALEAELDEASDNILDEPEAISEEPEAIVADSEVAPAAVQGPALVKMEQAEAKEVADEPIVEAVSTEEAPILTSKPDDAQEVAKAVEKAPAKAPKEILIDEPRPTHDNAPSLAQSAREVHAAEPAPTPESSRNVFLIDPKLTEAVEASAKSAKPKAVKPQAKKPLPIPGGHKAFNCFVAPDYDVDVLLEHPQKMTDHFIFGGRPSGLGLFAGENPNELILMVNHQLGENDAPMGMLGDQAGRVGSDLLYQTTPPTYGGVTRHVFNRYSGKMSDQTLALAGTSLNAAGCATPWGTFLSAAGNKPTQQRLFEMDVAYRGVGVPFWKEVEISFQSILVDPLTQIFYFTKDEPVGYFYRIRPDLRNYLSEDMPVEVLCIQRWPAADSRNVDATALKMQTGGYYDIYWRSVASLTNSTGMTPATMANTATRFGAVRSMTMFGGSLYFVTDATGASGNGQLFELKGDSLRLVEEFGEEGPVNPTAVVAVKSSGPLVVAGSAPEGKGSKLYVMSAPAQWTPILVTRTPVAAVVSDPVAQVIYLSLPEEGRVLRLFPESLGK